MKDILINDEKIVRLIDVLEQIQDVNRMIILHESDEDDLMSSQYEYRKAKFLQELKALLEAFDVRPADLAAA